MKKNNSAFGVFFSKLVNSRKNSLQQKKYKNYTSLVNNFKTKIELN